VSISPRELYLQSAVLKDCNTLLEDCLTLKSVGDMQEIDSLIALQQVGPRYHHNELSLQIVNVCKNIKSAVDALKRGIAPESSSVKTALQSANMNFNEIPKRALRLLRETRWSTKYYTDIGKEYETFYRTIDNVLTVKSPTSDNAPQVMPPVR
jgi:hypothetical protein